jgi:molybdopterin converting factor small subunit
MKVYVSFWGSLDVTIRKNEIDIEDGTTIAQLLENLITSYPELKSKVNFELVLINSVYTSIEKNLKNGDKIIIIPPITN